MQLLYAGMDRTQGTQTHSHTHTHTSHIRARQRHSIFCVESFLCGNIKNWERSLRVYEKGESNKTIRIEKTTTHKWTEFSGRVYSERSVLTALPIPFDCMRTRTILGLNKMVDSGRVCEWIYFVFECSTKEIFFVVLLGLLVGHTID